MGWWVKPKGKLLEQKSKIDSIKELYYGICNIVL